MTTDIRVPALGESVIEATVAKWLKQKGDAVIADEPLVELETDKVSIEAPAPSSGVLAEIVAAEGDTVEIDALLGRINDAAPGDVQETPAEPSKAASDASGAGELVEVRVPASGESVTEADIGAWLKQVGDAVEADEPIVSLETDKAAMDVPSPVGGVITKVAAEEGDTVEVGELLAIIQTGAQKTNGAAIKSSSRPVESESTQGIEMPLSPAPRRVVAERGLDPSTIEGTGKDGRVTKADAISATSEKAPVARAPRVVGEREERVKMSRLRQTIARRLKEAQDTAAMLTTFNDVDMTAVIEMRKQYKELFEKKHGIKLGFMSLFVKSCVHALKEVPEVNAEIDGADIIYKNHYDIGIAVGSDKGLVVPIVRDADQMSLAEIELSIAEYGRRARSGELKLAEMQGGTFTISNGGIYGSLLSTPILNMPQSGILGMHRIEERPVVRDGQVVVRPMMYLALSYDHRIVDGKGAVTFLVRVKENLEDPQRLLLDL